MSPNSQEEIVLPKLAGLLNALENKKGSSPEMVLLKTLLEDMKEGVLIVVEKSRQLFLNSAARSIFGGIRSLKTAPEKWSEAYGIYRMDGSEFFKFEELPLARALQGETTDNVELFLRNENIPQGLSLRVRGRPLKDDQGKIQGGIVFCQDITDLQRERVRAQRLADLVAFAPIAIIEVTTDARVVSWNSCAEKIYGYRPEEIVGKHYSMLVPILKVPLMQEHAQKLSRGEAVEDHATLRIRKDGRIITTSCAAAPLLSPDQKVRGFLLFTRDTTGREPDSLAEKTSDAILTISLEGLITSWNSAAERVFGHSKQEAVGLHYASLFPPGTVEEVRALYETVRMGQAAYDFDTQILSKTGGLLDATLSFSPSKNEDGKVAGLCAVIRDVTELKLAENRISHWQSLVDSSTEGVARDDFEGKILYWNKGCENIYGYSSGEILGKPFSMLIPGGDPEEFRKVLSYIQKGHGAQYEGLRKRKDGRLIHVAATLLPLRDKTGRVTEASIYIRDITERVQLRDALRRQEERVTESQKMEVIGRMASGVAHDFNNLLTAIHGNSQILAESPLGEEGKEALENVHFALARAAELARQLMAFGRGGEMTAKKLDLNDLIREEAKLLQRIIPKQCLLEAKPGLGVPAIEADGMELRQLLMNLVVNAKDALPGGGEIILETRLWESRGSGPDGAPLEPGPYAWLLVADNGTGMDGETKKHIFEPFFTTKGEGKGTGLGLAIVYAVAVKRGGRVWVESEIGKGTTFHMCFPAAKASK